MCWSTALVVLAQWQCNASQKQVFTNDLGWVMVTCGGVGVEPLVKSATSSTWRICSLSRSSTWRICSLSSLLSSSSLSSLRRASSSICMVTLLSCLSLALSLKITQSLHSVTISWEIHCSHMQWWPNLFYLIKSSAEFIEAWTKFGRLAPLGVTMRLVVMRNRSWIGKIKLIKNIDGTQALPLHASLSFNKKHAKPMFYLISPPHPCLPASTSFRLRIQNLYLR